MILVLSLEKSETGISYSFEDLNADQKQEKSALVEDLEVRLLFLLLQLEYLQIDY